MNMEKEDSIYGPLAFNGSNDKEARVQLIVWAISGMFVLIALVTSVKLIRNHLIHFSKPGIQRKIIGILWMVPIYASTSWLSLRFKTWSLFLDMFRDCYEAYVIYLFLALMVAYLGDGSDDRVVRILRTLPDLSHPFPFHYCNPPIKMGRKFLRDCKMAAMQFVVLKPLTGFLAILLERFDMYGQGHFVFNRGYLYLSLIINASVTYAFYYLVLFYLALGTHLKPYNPVPKFLCVKAVLFLSYWQSVVLAFLSRFDIIHQLGTWTTDDVTNGIQNVLICLEMMIISFVHTYAFPYDQYHDTTNSYHLRDSILSENFAFDDALRDFNEVMPIVLPSGFKPSSNIKENKKMISPGIKSTRTTLKEPSPTKNTLKEPFLNPKDIDRGWKL